MRVVIAPDKFKGSLSAAEVAAAVAAGLPSSWEVARLPVADGGDGTVDAAVAAGFERVPVTASGPTGSPVRTSYARRGAEAVVELADVCGLARLPGGRPAPMEATSRGLGEVLAQAVADGARQVVVGIGGSASTDGGRGLREALSDVDLSGVELVVAFDVTNPLLGPDGAAAVYGPQKGASPEQVAELEGRLDAYADEVGREHVDTPGAGAAGGVGFGLLTLGAELRAGIDVVLDLIGFTDVIRGADLVITGEGALDAQTLRGKAPAGVAAAARDAGARVAAVAGSSALDGTGPFDAVYVLSDLEPDRDRSMRAAASLLTELAHHLASDPALRPAHTRLATREVRAGGEKS